MVLARKSLTGWRLGVTAVAGVAAFCQAWLPTQVGRASSVLGASGARAAQQGVRVLGMWASGSLLAGGRLSPAQAAPRASVPGRQPLGSWKQLAPGIRYRTVPVQLGVSMQQVLVDPRLARLGLWTSSPSGSSSKPLFAGPLAVSDLARRAKLLVAINASYFDERGEPLGYLKAQGRVRCSALATGAAFTGVFTVRKGVPAILAREAYRPGDEDLALQAGPRLVAGGKPTHGLRERRSFRQTGVGVTRDGDVLLYVTDGLYSGLTWEATRRVLLGAAGQGGVPVTDVLNLDGGSSSQMFVAAPACISTGFPTRVPVVLGATRL